MRSPQTDRVHRRTVLAAACVPIASLGVAGCLEGELQQAEHPPPPFQDRLHPEELNLPVRQRLEVAAEAIGQADGYTFEEVGDLVEYVEGAGLTVSAVDEQETAGDPLIEMEHLPNLESRGIMQDLGIIAGGFAGLIAAGHEAGELSGTLLDEEENRFGTYHIDRHWAEAFNHGTDGPRTYANEVAGTLESTQ